MRRSAIFLVGLALSLALNICTAMARTDEPVTLMPRLVNAFPAADLLLGRPDVPVLRLASLEPFDGSLRGSHVMGDGELNLFHSVAVPVGELATTRKWRGVTTAEFDGALVTGAAARLLASLASAATMPDFEAIDLVNRTVNRAIAYRADAGDDWATAMETAARGAGDCEDYAILKHWLLRNLGFSEAQLQLVVLKERRRGLNHAVLAVHLDTGTFILDNLTNTTTTDAAFLNYQPLVSFVGDKTFLHGFNAGAPAKVASAAP